MPEKSKTEKERKRTLFSPREKPCSPCGNRYQSTTPHRYAVTNRQLWKIFSFTATFGTAIFYPRRQIVDCCKAAARLATIDSLISSQREKKWSERIYMDLIDNRFRDTNNFLFV